MNTPTDTNLRSEIVREIMTLVQPEPQEIKPRPTIDELEKMLNSDTPQEIDIRPDGSIYTRPPAHTTVGAVADTILRVIGEHNYSWAQRDTLRAQNAALRAALNTLLLNFGTVEPGDSVAIDVARAALSQTEGDDK